jgi:antirestriction protein
MTHESSTTTRQPQAEVITATEPSSETAPQLQPRIWLASVTDHEWGIKHGAWVSANQAVSGIRADLDRMLAHSPIGRRNGKPVSAWAIFGSADFGSYQVGHHDSLHWLSQIGHGIAQHGTAFAAWANLVHDADQLADYDAVYLGHYDSLESYIEQRINELGYDRAFDEVVPEQLRPWVKIDLAATARNLHYGGDLHAVPADQGGIWIFDGHR